MISNMDWQIFWTVLGGAFGGALIGALATILVTRMNHKHERKKWLLQEKFKAYIDAQVIFQGLQSRDHLSNLMESDSNGLVTRTHSALSRIDLLAPESVRKAVTETRNKITTHEDQEQLDQFKVAISQLLASMREDLHKTKSKKHAK